MITNGFKFGGKALATRESINNVVEITKTYRPEIIIISAVGGVTTQLEVFANGYLSGDRNMMKGSLQRIHELHEPIFEANGEMPEEAKQYFDILTKLSNGHSRFYNLVGIVQDAIQSMGEKISSLLLSSILSKNSFTNELVLPSFIRTDANFGNANVIREEFLEELRGSKLVSLIQKGKSPVIPGYIAWCSVEDDGFIDALEAQTTLGREGSDYTSGLILRGLKEIGAVEEAELTLWKDKDGVGDKDPELGLPVQFYQNMTYQQLREAVAYGKYAEGLVHPKTVDEVEAGQIILRIKNFWHPELPGTLIS